MLFSKIKSLRTRNSFKINEIKKKLNKFLFVNLLNNKNINRKDKKLILLLLLKNIKSNKILNKTKTRITSRCIVTNRSRGNYKYFGFSRIVLRELMQFGILPGYYKAVW